MNTTTLHITGMTCALCSVKIERCLLALEDVSAASVNFTNETAVIIHQDVSVDSLEHAIRKAGFGIDHDGTGADRAFYRLGVRFLVSAILSAPLIVMMLVCTVDECCIALDPAADGFFSVFISVLRSNLWLLHDWKTQAILAFPVQFIIGFRFYRRAFYSIRSRIWGMDVLIAMSTTVTYLYSVWIGLQPDYDATVHLYFESSAMIVTLILLGELLESGARKNTRSAVQSLSNLVPHAVHRVVCESGKRNEMNIDIGLLERGFLVAVYPGERIPADGVIESGVASVDESMLSGESVPLGKTQGNTVTGGTMNIDGYIEVRITRTGSDSILGQIIAEVESAQAAKAGIQRITDRICSYFVPTVLAVSLGTFCIWFFAVFRGNVFLLEKPLLYAVSVLVVSCPCALGLAVPAAISIGLGTATRRKILIRNGEVLERAWKTSVVVFDKTGTLSESVPAVQEAETKVDSSFSPHELLRLAAAAERPSVHPFGRAICSLFPDDTQLPSSFTNAAGKGIIACINGSTVVVGSRALLAEESISVEGFKTRNRPGVYVAVDGIYEGMIFLEDRIRDSSSSTVEKLDSAGIKTLLVSGDSFEAVEAVARRTGIGTFFSGVSPAGKGEIVKDLKDNGFFVLMTGDGINDSPALALADIGVVPGCGSAVAIHTGDVVLLDNNLESIPWLIAWSRRVMRTVRCNIAFAFLYNAIAIPLAVTGHLVPEVACLAMTVSSLCVLVNSLLLGRNDLHA